MVLGSPLPEDNDVKLVELVMNGGEQLLLEMTDRDVDDLVHSMRMQSVYRLGGKYIVTTQIMWVNTAPEIEE